MGTQKSVTIDGVDKQMSFFYGIPFGETTGGANRFQKPIPKAPFTDTFEAKKYPAACIQYSPDTYTSNYYGGEFSEDCLTLNIYAPYDFTNQTSFPVMIWVFGGSFTEGAAGLYPATGLSGFGNVIVVTINYRVGMFGFLRSSDGKLIGNQGLWDQQLAIKWVHDNIAAFYGNPDDVTIFGESAGSVSVLYQAIYPGNKGLFKRVIAESGSPLVWWAFTEPNAKQYINRTKCASDLLDPINCLYSLQPSELQLNTSVKYDKPLYFYPTVDNDFLKGTPQEIFLGNDTVFLPERNFFVSLDIVVGFNSLDGIGSPLRNPNLIFQEPFNMTRAIFNDMLTHYMTDIIHPKGHLEEEVMRSVIEFTYIDWQHPDDTETLSQNMLDIATDVTMLAPCLAVAESHSRLGGSTYVYLYSAKPDVVSSSLPKWVKGANHGDELEIVFGIPLYGPGWRGDGTYSDREKSLSRAVMTFWYNFANTGEPYSTSLNRIGYKSDMWPKYTTVNPAYLDIDIMHATVHEGFRPARMALWNDLIPHIREMFDRPTERPEKPFVPVVIGK